MGEAMRPSLITRGRALLRRLAGDRAGNTAVTFAITAPVIFGAVGIGIDLASAVNARSQMQAVADSAAVFAAREFQMAQSNVQKISELARNYALSQIQGVTVTTSVDAAALKVQVRLEKDIELTLARAVLNSNMHVSVSATAKMSDGLPLCLLALEPKNKAAIKLRTDARLTAPACIVNSNSTNPEGMISLDNAVMQAGFICTAGGKIKTKNTNYTPDPVTDCPVMADPLAQRQLSTDSVCNHLLKRIDGTVTTINPGVYCGGLWITDGAQVTMNPGTYVIKDGPFVVNGGASLTGNGVSIVMKGFAANLTFHYNSTISLKAPTSGNFAGILIYDDPAGIAAPLLKPLLQLLGLDGLKYEKEGKSPREHLILSDNARMLLGTIYMPKGRLIIDTTKPIADKSAYTVLVVQQLDLYDGPNLYLNTDYQGSDVPVPQGVGPYGGKVILTN